MFLDQHMSYDIFAGISFADNFCIISTLGCFDDKTQLTNQRQNEICATLVQ